MEIIKKDQFIFGMLIGLFLPIVLFFLILLLNYILLQMGVAKFYLNLEAHILISMFGNLLSIRYYFVNLTFEKTGRGVLLVTFVVILLFFILKDSLGINL